MMSSKLAACRPSSYMHMCTAVRVASTCACNQQQSMVSMITQTCCAVATCATTTGRGCNALAACLHGADCCTQCPTHKLVDTAIRVIMHTYVHRAMHMSLAGLKLPGTLTRLMRRMLVATEWHGPFSRRGCLCTTAHARPRWTCCGALARHSDATTDCACSCRVPTSLVMRTLTA